MNFQTLVLLLVSTTLLSLNAARRMPIREENYHARQESSKKTSKTPKKALGAASHIRFAALAFSQDALTRSIAKDVDKNHVKLLAIFDIPEDKRNESIAELKNRGYTAHLFMKGKIMLAAKENSAVAGNGLIYTCSNGRKIYVTASTKGKASDAEHAATSQAAKQISDADPDFILFHKAKGDDNIKIINAAHLKGFVKDGGQLVIAKKKVKMEHIDLEAPDKDERLFKGDTSSTLPTWLVIILALSFPLIVGLCALVYILNRAKNQ